MGPLSAQLKRLLGVLNCNPNVVIKLMFKRPPCILPQGQGGRLHIAGDGVYNNVIVSLPLIKRDSVRRLLTLLFINQSPQQDPIDS